MRRTILIFILILKMSNGESPEIASIVKETKKKVENLNWSGKLFKHMKVFNQSQSKLSTFYAGDFFYDLF